MYTERPTQGFISLGIIIERQNCLIRSSLIEVLYCHSKYGQTANGQVMHHEPCLRSSQAELCLPMAIAVKLNHLRGSHKIGKKEEQIGQHQP